MRRFTTQMVNLGGRPLVGRLPGVGILTHVGRTSGRRYRTPLFVLERGDDYVFALTHGSNAHRVKNILTAGGREVRVLGRDVRLIEPESFFDKTRRLLPSPSAWLAERCSFRSSCACAPPVQASHPSATG